ncbi:MAG: methyltransferase [Patescibacteria group bacterium]
MFNYFSKLRSVIQSRGISQQKFYSRILGKTIFVKQNVFYPDEAEHFMLPFMKSRASLFRNARVLEIGSGAGLISLYAAKLGAKNVLATDINSQAIQTLEKNKRLMSFGSVIKTKHVTAIPPAAYAGMTGGKKFDVIISNPPYGLDLDAARNTPLVDTGALGISLVGNLKRFLTPDGTGIFLYRSPFYHQFIVNYAEFLGYGVHHFAPDVITPWEYETLGKLYMKYILKKFKLPVNAFNFSLNATWQETHITYPQDHTLEITADPKLVKPDHHKFPGIILIRNRDLSP